MLQVRKSAERGHANHGWLDSWHSFSFADYHDPAFMGFGPLRVINEDRIAAGAGFGTHGHRDMEIISYVLDGELAHKDNMGNGSVIRPGDVQRMSAGRGVMHSEFNHAQDRQTHFLQIWIEPNVRGIAPSYEEKNFTVADKRGKLRLIASPGGTDGSVTLHQDARIFAGLFDGAERATLTLDRSRPMYVHVATGAIQVNGTALGAGDAVRVLDETQLMLSDGQQAQVLVFDLPS